MVHGLGAQRAQYVHKYLAAKGKAPGDVAGFKAQLHDLWFHLYRRKADNDSSRCGSEMPCAVRDALSSEKWICMRGGNFIFRR